MGLIQQLYRVPAGFEVAALGRRLEARTGLTYTEERLDQHTWRVHCSMLMTSASATVRESQLTVELDPTSSQYFVGQLRAAVVDLGGEPISRDGQLRPPSAELRALPPFRKLPWREWLYAGPLPRLVLFVGSVLWLVVLIVLLPVLLPLFMLGAVVQRLRRPSG